MGKRVTQHVVPHPEGWAIKRGGAERATEVVKTKAEAVKLAREIARNQGAELVIHGEDGQIQNTNSYGNDPVPPRDTKH